MEKSSDHNIKLPVSGMYIISRIIEEQNYLLLKKIAKNKFSNQEDREAFIEEYHKINYHIPEISENHQQEKLQKYLL